MRVFIAIPLPEEIRARIADFQRRWQTGLPPSAIRWTPAEQIHLTLRFLGNVTSDAVAALEAGLRRGCADVASFELCAAGSGCFPDARKPRVVWVGVGGELDALGRLHRRVWQETVAWGEVEARQFQAHLTIGRVKPGPPAVLRELARRVRPTKGGELGRWRVGEVWLLRSVLSPAGAEHTVLARCALGGG